ncbi:MAG: TIGR04255 family protein [Gammaproteobacteria bacterium]|jgi:uncharacterized protein (TIGR04255 family)
MTNKQLRYPPLTYVLAQIKITPIEDIKSYMPKIQDIIRKEFPVYEEVNIQNFEIRKELNPIIHQATQWHFKDKDLTTGIIIDKQTINLHTSKYSKFDEFVAKFENILKSLNKQLGISLVIRFGLRYVNVVKSSIKKYVESGLLGFYEKDSEFLARTETISRESDGSTIQTKSIHVGSKASIGQNKLVPPDLAQVAGQLTFKHHEEPKNNYVIVDIDCGHKKQLEFKEINFKQEFTQLHNKIERIFNKAFTKEAVNKWL